MNCRASRSRTLAEPVKDSSLELRLRRRQPKVLIVRVDRFACFGQLEHLSTWARRRSAVSRYSGFRGLFRFGFAGLPRNWLDTSRAVPAGCGSPIRIRSRSRAGRWSAAKRTAFVAATPSGAIRQSSGSPASSGASTPLKVSLNIGRLVTAGVLPV